MNSNQETQSISFKQDLQFTEVFHFLLSKILWLIIAGISGCLITAIFVTVFITPKYESYITMYVHNNAELNSGSVINNNDLLAAESLAGTYEIILQSNVIFDSVIQEVNSDKNIKLNKPLSRHDLSDMVSVSTVNSTQLIKITASSTDPLLAYKIVDAYASVSPKQIVRVTKSGGVEVVDQAELSTSPVSPKTLIDSIIGFFVGFILLAVYYIIKMISDNTVYSENDIEKITDVPIIGTIPEVEMTNTEEVYWKAEKFNVLKYGRSSNSEKINANPTE